MAKVAKVIKTQEVELNLEELIALIKKNWSLLGGFLVCHLTNGNRIVRLAASFNLVSINKVLCQKEGLIADVDELGGALVLVFKDIQNQKPYFKNMVMSTFPSLESLEVSFEIDIAPIMPVDPMDIPGPDNPMDPDPTNRFSQPASPLTTAILKGGGNPDKVGRIAEEDPADQMLESDDLFLNIGRT